MKAAPIEHQRETPRDQLTRSPQNASRAASQFAARISLLDTLHIDSVFVAASNPREPEVSMRLLSIVVWASSSLAVAASSACGPGDPGVPGHPNAECLADADCEEPSSVCETSACVRGRCVAKP